jgi:hypothetical protein
MPGRPLKDEQAVGNAACFRNHDKERAMASDSEMHKLTAQDVLASARRAGWSITAERAAEIAAGAAPYLETFERIRARLTLDDDAAGFTAALVATSRQRK